MATATRAKLAALPDDGPELSYIVGSFVGPNLTTIGTIAAFTPLIFSSGNVTIASADAKDAHIINLNWLADAADRELAVVAVKRLRDVWATDAADAVKSGPELFPGVAVQTDAQILDYVTANAFHIWHACGTCAMGKPTGVVTGRAVVDAKARVFGVAGLRVCDASAFPFVVPGHPQAAVYGLAEKIADDMRSGS